MRNSWNRVIEGATFLVSTPRNKIAKGSWLEAEVKYLQSRGYEWAKDGNYLTRAK